MTAQALRILVVLPMYGGSLPIGRYCARALTDLGHTVRVFEAPALYPAFTGLGKLDLTPARKGPLEAAFLQVVAQAIWAQAEELAPQLVLALAQAPMSRNLLQRFRRAGVRTAMWFVEDYRLFTYWQAYAPLYDFFAVIQKEPFLSELAAIGQPHALYLPLAALPEFHKPLALSATEQREYGSDIAFLGAGYPNRRLAFRPLAGRDFKIWGSDWEGENLLARNIQRGGSRIGEEESVKIYNAAKVNLNLHSSVSAKDLVSHGDFLNPRTFELAAMGAFQLVDRRTLMDGLFGPDELATFESPEEFYQKIDYFLAHPGEREAYARRARERVLAEHTYERRMQTLLSAMEKELGPWRTEPREGAQAPGLDAALREELARLTGSLGLPPHAPFEDVMDRLRRRTGPLSATETALLFLDEWRRQYKK
ncbi:MULTISPECIES: glycosyltransferase [unclassified Desulfovibrio]|uniref:CgeB family protein n=1 Tax=unclassified Desulfovibrio TaxID=2593640 RepID=UPI001F14AE90|nr:MULTISPECIES: glycosyltransferase [unclassified Desulfovibrio]